MGNFSFLFSVVPFLLFIISYGDCGKLPDRLMKCKRSDPNLQQCLRVAVEDSFPKIGNGVKELGVLPLEPLNVPMVTIGEGKGAVHVLQKYKNLNLHHLTTAKVVKLNASLDEPFRFTAETFAPEYRLEADYDFNGRILLLPIVGNGKCAITLYEITTEITFTGEKFQKKGKTYVDIKEFKLTLKPKKVRFNFENLFNGDERLGKEMNNILNENWKEVFEDVRPGYEEFIASIGKHVANGIFNKVPFDDIFPQ